MKMATQEDLEFLIDRVPATNKVKGVSDYEVEKLLSQNKMKMNFENGVIGWVDKNSKLYLMGKDSRVLNGVDRTKEIINHLESKGYTQSPDVPVYENKTNKIIEMSNEFKRMQELAGIKLQENYELDEAAAENLELKSLQKKAYSALKGMGFDSKITSGEAGAGKTILSKQTYKDNRGVALVNLDPETGIFDVLVTSDSLKRDKDNKNQNLDPDQEANKVVDELEKLIDRNKFEVGYKQTNDRGGSIYQIFVRAKSTGKKGGVMATEALNEHYVAGGIVGVGAINNPFEGRKKESYEDAFEYFLNKKYSLNEIEDDMPEAPSHEETDAAQVYEEEINEAEESVYMKLKNILFPLYKDLKGEERAKKIDEVIKELKEYISILQNEKSAK